MTGDTGSTDPIALQVFQQRLIGIVREMRATMIHSAFSAAICELYDLSCALLSAKGELVVQSEDNPQHVFPLLWSARELIRQYGNDIHPDDVFLHNDPYEGGTHLNDIAVIVPFFVDDRLVCFPVVRAHWEDVGGATHGSISGQNREIFQEGIRIPLTRLRAGSRELDAFLNLLYANMRIPHEREGDFRAMMGTCEVARRRLQDVVARYGTDEVLSLADALLDQEERRMTARLRRLPDGEVTFQSYLDPRPDLGITQRICARVLVDGDEIEVDFAGSSAQIDGPFNIGPSCAPTGVFIILKSLVDPDGPVNSGSFRPIKVLAPQGSFLNATYPAAVGAMGDVRRALESAVMGALVPVMPGRVTGDTKGTSNQLLIGGTRGDSKRVWLLYEAPAGGTGGFAGEDGNSALRTFAEGDFTAIQPIEAVEQKFPLRVEECSLRTDSSGDGEFRGGLGMRRVIRLLAVAGSLSSVSDRNVIPPFGVFGGTAGLQNAIGVARQGVALHPSRAPGKVANFKLEKDDLIVFKSSGGGGYGDPLDRDVARVARDVQLGYVSPERAREVYGVIMNDNGVDENATRARRRQLRRGRIVLELVREEGPANQLKLPTALVHPSLAKRARLKVGDIAEVLVARTPVTPVQVVIASLPRIGRHEIGLGQELIRFCNWRKGTRLWLRALPATVAALRD